MILTLCVAPYVTLSLFLSPSLPLSLCVCVLLCLELTATHISQMLLTNLELQPNTNSFDKGDRNVMVEKR